MKKNYYIFKTDKVTGKTTHICNGSHDSEHECRIHWQSYMYGFMDQAFELLGAQNFQMRQGEHELSFELYVPQLDGKCIEYFMLFDKEGRDLIYETCNQ